MKRAKAKSNTGGAKIVVYTRLRPQTVRALDDIRGSLPFSPSRAQIIDAALAEYVERHSKYLKHAEMLELAGKSLPPQSWFEEDVQKLRRGR